MPFVAIREDGGGRVYIDQYENPRQALSGVEFYCQDCQAPMTIRMGDIVRAHFAHKPGYEDRPCWFRTSGETEAHMASKRGIAAALARSPFFASGHIEVEYPIETATGRRYIDVYVELPDGRRFAHEAQLASQSIDQFERRTGAYRSVGLIPVWWLGQSANTRENRAWCEGQCDYIGTITISRERAQIISEHYDANGSVAGDNGYARQ